MSVQTFLEVGKGCLRLALSLVDRQTRTTPRRVRRSPGCHSGAVSRPPPTRLPPRSRRRGPARRVPQFRSCSWKPQLQYRTARIACMPDLNLWKKHLGQVPQSVWNQTELETLVLADNDLSEVSEQIGRLRKLRMLDLGHNQLTRVPDALADLDGLTDFLYLHDNRLTSLPAPLPAPLLHDSRSFPGSAFAPPPTPGTPAARRENPRH